VIQRQIEATDREIDGLVYELYGLMDDCPCFAPCGLLGTRKTCLSLLRPIRCGGV
jgi:hypothetical protein